MTEKNRIEKFENYMGSIVSPENIRRLIDWGFFAAPASTKYHGNYEGGLFDHSFAVMKSLVELSERNLLKWERGLDSPLIVGMFHDLCKVDNYIRVLDGYEYNKNTLLTGHGEKSVMLLSTLMNLTAEEVMCIRYHMGAFTDKEEWGNYTRAVNNYPNVLWTHHADMIASQILGV